jgi:threonine dehydratase
MRAVIVMPADAPEVKIAGVRAEGGEVVFVQDRSERSPTAERLEREQGLISIPPYEHRDVVAGQGTVGLEILEQLPDVQEILVPVGGGGLLAGICAAVSGLAPEVKVTGVEPEGAAKLSAALAAQRPVSVGAPKSIADGLLPPKLGDIPWSCVSGVVSRAVTVSDESIGAAVRYLHEVAGLRVEPSGATTVAALLSGVEVRAPVVAVLSGGNVDPALFQSLVA